MSWNNWSRESRKRRLNYNEDIFNDKFDVDDYDSPEKSRHKSASKLTSVTKSLIRQNEWDRAMEGFKGLMEKPQKKKISSDSKQQSNKASERLEDTKIRKPSDPRGRNYDPPLSQADIDWESSDEEGEISKLSSDESPPPSPKFSSKFSQKQKKKCVLEDNSDNSSPYIQTASSKSSFLLELSTTKLSPDLSGESPPSSYTDGIIDICISEYNSDTEKQDDEPLNQSNKLGSEELDSSINISTATQSPQEPVSTDKLKGSDWLKKVTWHKTPEKSQNTETCAKTPVDSGKKKKQKYIRDGLAEQLLRLQQREKTAHTFWSHKKTEKKNAMMLKVKSIEKSDSHLQIATCVNISDQMPGKRCIQGELNNGNRTSSDPKSTQNVVENNSKLDIVMPTIEPNECGNASECFEIPKEDIVMSTKETSERGNTSEGFDIPTEEYIVLLKEDQAVKQGCVIKIDPPWQRLDLPSSKKPVILCTQFTQVIQQPDDVMKQPDDVMKQPDDVMKQPDDVTAKPKPSNCLVPIASWQCPCSLDPDVCYKDCVANMNPCVGTWAPGPKSIQCFNSPTNPPRLQLVKSQPSQLDTPEMPRSILESIEKQGDGATVSFRATLQRLFCWKDSKTERTEQTMKKTSINPTDQNDIRFSLLIEDIYGSFCVLEVPHGWAESKQQRDFIEEAVAKECIFTSLKVTQRTYKDRCLGLFGVIESVWRPDVLTVKHSQESQESCPDIPLIQVPTFCYKLTPTSRDWLRVASADISKIHYKSSNLTLTDLQKPDISQRCSVYCKPIYSRKNVASQGNIHLYVTDSTSGGHIPHITVGPRCVTDDQVAMAIQEGTDCLYLQDLLVNSGNVCCDEYTRLYSGNIVPKSTREKLLQTKMNIPEVSLNSKKHSIVSVCGVITGIDESTAYAWPVCDQCGNERLQAKQNTRELFCLECKCFVLHPVTRMRLDVLVQTKMADIVKVQLLQSTIENLLPTDSADEEGYDLDCVLKRPIGPISCITKETLHEIRPCLSLEEICLKINN
ncbi:unnamed protein product [Owenia fusiformis]|uniref:DUF4503 domain-containing protein n=1 Tax=Owenia fusiformis TaxID=6347 RepID=A0A8S4NG49_OWEFU|nr:unnamed protein product [Owenia fusiformis]